MSSREELQAQLAEQMQAFQARVDAFDELVAARLGVNRTDLRCVEILMAPRNPASRRVAEKAGAYYEGLLRRRIACHGTVHDANLFSLVPADLDPGRPTT